MSPPPSFQSPGIIAANPSIVVLKHLAFFLEQNRKKSCAISSCLELVLRVSALRISSFFHPRFSLFPRVSGGFGETERMVICKNQEFLSRICQIIRRRAEKKELRGYLKLCFSLRERWQSAV